MDLIVTVALEYKASKDPKSEKGAARMIIIFLLHVPLERQP